MKQYEYHDVSIHWDERSKKFSAQGGDQQFTGFLNTLKHYCQNGWQLVGLVQRYSVSRITQLGEQIYIAIFERPR